MRVWMTRSRGFGCHAVPGSGPYVRTYVYDIVIIPGIKKNKKNMLLKIQSGAGGVGMGPEEGSRLFMIFLISCASLHYRRIGGEFERGEKEGTRTNKKKRRRRRRRRRRKKTL